MSNRGRHCFDSPRFQVYSSISVVWPYHGSKWLVGELGDRLRKARENKGLSLEQVEEGTRIRRAFLEALEEEDFEKLPASAYVKGFIRNYAQFLGLDPEESLSHYRAMIGASSSYAPSVLDEPLLPDSGTNVWVSALLALLAVAVLAVAGWYAYNRFYLGVDPWPVAAIPKMLTLIPGQPLPSATPSAVPKVIQSTPTQESPTPTMEPVEEAIATPTTVATPTTRPTVTPEPTRTPTLTPTTSRTPSATPTPTASPTPTPTIVDSIRVEAVLLAKTYVKVIVDGELVLEETLSEGEDQVWIARQGFSMRVGNAAGLILYVNGIQVPPLGAKGEVVDIEYTLDNLPGA